VAAPRPRGRDEVVEALLASARRLIAEHGPSVALRDIADDAGVNFGLLYHYLGTKDQLLDAVYTAAAQSAADRLGDAEDLGDAVHRLLRLGDGTTARLVGWAVLEGRGTSPVFRDSPALALLRTLVQRDAERSGVTLDDDEAQRFAAFTMTVALGWRLFAEPALLAAGFDDPDPAPHQEHVIRYVRRLAEQIVVERTGT
jgi:TetR/AcrR family transcriptional regulator, repressor for neighboring sulfatase